MPTPRRLQNADPKTISWSSLTTYWDLNDPSSTHGCVQREVTLENHRLGPSPFHSTQQLGRSFQQVDNADAFGGSLLPFSHGGKAPAGPASCLICSSVSCLSLTPPCNSTRSPSRPFQRSALSGHAAFVFEPPSASLCSSSRLYMLNSQTTPHTDHLLREAFPDHSVWRSPGHLIARSLLYNIIQFVCVTELHRVRVRERAEMVGKHG